MNYIGKLYGKVGRRQIPLMLTSEDVDRMEAALRRVAKLNPNAGEIGAGMLKTIVEEARKALKMP